MWGGAAVAGLGLAALGSRTGAPHSRVAAFAYPPLLALAFAAMVWTGHEGGSLSHGARFLTEEMPDPLRRWLGVAVNRPAPAGAATPLDTHAAALGAGRIAARVAAPPSGGGWNDPRAYAARIAPLFERSCVPCHRPGKRKGGLRMDTYAQLVAGGEDGPVIVPGDPRGSELVRRITLPADDDDYMPSDGRKPLSAEEVAAVEQWIAAGAKGP
jgi:mono/diheme cytochrome c family protein